MKEYHKIQSIFKRDEKNKILMGKWTCPEFEYLADKEWMYTEKVDGTNVRIMFDGEKITFGGKTNQASLPTKLVNQLNEKFSVQQFKECFKDKKVCFYGEGYGSGIQKGQIYRSDQSFVLFDVLLDNWWIRRSDLEDIASKFELEIVPVIGQGTLHNAITLVANGLLSQWGNFPAEGIVARPIIELFDRAGHRIITKIKNRDFC